jgi:hypothetical protein
MVNLMLILAVFEKKINFFIHSVSILLFLRYQIRNNRKSPNQKQHTHPSLEHIDCLFLSHNFI